MSVLAGNGGAVGIVAGVLGDEAGAEGIPTELGEPGGVLSEVLGVAADGLVHHSAGQRCGAVIAVFRKVRNNGAQTSVRGKSTAHMPGEPLAFGGAGESPKVPRHRTRP